MRTPTIRPAYSNWPRYNRQLRDVVAILTDEQLAIRPAPERWPIWATIGHAACQRVSWLCGFAGEPGAEATPFPDALYRCPGDEYLEPVMVAAELVEALDSTFRVVENVLDTWTIDLLDKQIRRTFGDRELTYTRGSVIQRLFAHDVYHVAELNETFAAHGLPLVNLWD
jgi:uncharacterized damage-inducible protein DinB